MKRKPDCGVVAVATALDLSYDIVWRFFGKTKKSNWRGRLFWSDLSRACRYFEAEVREIVGQKTLPKFIEWHTVPGLIYIIRVGGHFVTVKDGIVTDNNGTAPTAEHYWTKRKRVSHAMIVTPQPGELS